MSSFLKDAENQLKGCMDKAAVMAELSDHVETKQEFFEDIGYDKTASAQKADEAMGSGEIVGQRLKALHIPDYKKINLISFAIVLCNIAIPFVAGIPGDENTFIRPFFSGILMLIVNLLFTAFAVKRKNRQFSFLILVFSFVTMHISASKLAYPVCNLLLSDSNSEGVYDKYKAVRIMLVALVLLILIFPNAYNLYYCRQIERMKNTRKQNEFSKGLISFCVILSIVSGLCAYPSYCLNKSYADKQREIQREFVDFILDLEENFDCTQTAELEDYLKNCQYDFKITERTASSSFRVVYQNNWMMCVTIDETGYYVCASNLFTAEGEEIINSSQTYLFADYGTENELIEYLGDDEVSGLTGNAVGMSKAEIRNKMNEIDYISFGYDCSYKNDNQYDYQWILSSSLYGLFGYSHYVFYFDNNDICTSYGLTLD